MMKKLRQNGDTIVEVLIAIAVLSLVLGGAYSIAGKSFNNMRQAQEHGVALKLAERQIEQIKSLAKSESNDELFTETSPFCLDYEASLGELKVLPATSCVYIIGVEYTVVNTRSGADPSHTFTTNVSWASIHGNDFDDSVTLTYRIGRLSP